MNAMRGLIESDDARSWWWWCSGVVAIVVSVFGPGAQ